MSLLIYDSTTSTHLFEFCEYILDYLIENKNHQTIHILINEKVATQLEKIGGKYLPQSLFDNNIFIHSITSKYQLKFNKCKSVFYLSFLEEKFINDFCIKNNINEVLFLQLDIYQLIIGVRNFLLRKRLIISGILLSPFTFYPLKLRLIRARKFLQILCMMLNSNIKQIFILNDHKSVLELNKKFRTTKFTMLVDPLIKRNFVKKDFRKDFDIRNDEVVFLSLGGVSHRKNLHNILQAFNLLSDNLLSKVRLMISGKIHDVEYLHSLQSILTSKISEKIIFLNHYIEIDEFESLIFFSDAIFTVYVNFYSSSGVVGNASKHHKPVIASNTGVIGHIVNEFSLGVTVDPHSVDEIASAIVYFIENIDTIAEKAQFEDYNTRNRFDRFAESLLNLAY